MTTKHHSARTGRDVSPPQGEKHAPAQDQNPNPERPGSQEDVLILLAQQIRDRRNPSRYLEGWIRRFVRG